MPSSEVPTAVPYTSDEERIVGSMARGTPKAFRSASSQSSVRRSISSVRLAFVTSVACTPPSTPPVRFHNSQVSGVPNSSSPLSARSRAPSTLSRIQAILDAEKYVASGSPVVSAKRRTPPSAASVSMSACVRVSCQTIAL